MLDGGREATHLVGIHAEGSVDTNQGALPLRLLCLGSGVRDDVSERTAPDGACSVAGQSGERQARDLAQHGVVGVRVHRGDD